MTSVSFGSWSETGINSRLHRGPGAADSHHPEGKNDTLLHRSHPQYFAGRSKRFRQDHAGRGRAAQGRKHRRPGFGATGKHGMRFRSAGEGEWSFTFIHRGKHRPRRDPRQSHRHARAARLHWPGPEHLSGRGNRRRCRGCTGGDRAGDPAHAHLGRRTQSLPDDRHQQDRPNGRRHPVPYRVHPGRVRVGMPAPQPAVEGRHRRGRLFFFTFRRCRFLIGRGRAYPHRRPGGGNGRGPHGPLPRAR